MFRLTFNYHFVYKEKFNNHIKVTFKIHDLWFKLSYIIYDQADIKHDYWKILIHSNNKHYLSFNIFDLSQLQFTKMSQKTRILFFTFIKIMNIVIKSISELKSELSLLYETKLHESNELIFYIDDIFIVHDFYEKQFVFFKNHFLSRIL